MLHPKFRVQGEGVGVAQAGVNFGLGQKDKRASAFQYEVSVRLHAEHRGNHLVNLVGVQAVRKLGGVVAVCEGRQVVVANGAGRLFRRQIQAVISPFLGRLSDTCVVFAAFQMLKIFSFCRRFFALPFRKTAVPNCRQLVQVLEAAANKIIRLAPVFSFPPG